MHHSRATVILTRPQGKNQALQLRFEQAGLRVVTLPALTLQPIAVTPPVPDPAAFDLVFFVSGFAVDCFFDLLAEQGMHWPQGQHAGCVGPGTVQALQRQGVAQQQILCPAGIQPYDSSGFLTRLKASDVFASLKSVLIACGTTGNPWLARQLQDLSLEVTRLPLYRRDARLWDVQQRRQMRSLLVDLAEKKYVVLTSPQGIEAFVDNLVTAQIDPTRFAGSTTFVVTHAGQVDSLKHAWQQKLPAGNASTLHIVQALPQDDAIFHTVTISDKKPAVIHYNVQIFHERIAKRCIGFLDSKELKNMEKKQDDARNTENEKKPEAAGHHAQQERAAPDTVTDVELANEKSTAEKTTAHAGHADTAAKGKPVSGAAGGAIPPIETGKDDSNAGKGTKGPLIAAFVVVAAIAAGGYYYAQNNQSEPDSSSQTASESASTAPEEAPASDAGQPGQTSDADATADSSDSSSSSQSDAAGNAESAQSADTTLSTAGSSDAQADAEGPSEGASSVDPASTTSDEASGSTSSTPVGPAATNSEPTQTGAEATGNSTTAQSAGTTSGDNTSGDALSANASAQDTAATPSSAAGASATTVDTPQASGTPSATVSSEGGFNGSLPADIRDQLDRQSAQIIALRDQLESSQKQLQQLQTSRLQASRDETALFVANDVSRLVTMAQNELAIAGNLENAVTSLETAIKAIDQADAPVLAGLRGALSADIVTLKSAPTIGVDAQFAQVAALSGKIDTLPMLAPDQAGAKPMAGQSSDVHSPAVGANNTNPAASSDVWYERAWNEVKTWPVAAWNGLRSDLGGIVRVEKLADPNQVLLTVDQAARLRANLQQHLHFAQQALLNGQQGIWTSSLETVVKGIKQSFNQDSVETQQVLAQLQQLLKAGVRQQMPPITQSVKAVQETRKQLKSMNPGQE